jgi:hypothetical protein
MLPDGSVGLGDLYELGECVRILDRHLGEHLAINFDLGGFQPGDELAVGRPVLAGRSVDTGDPELAKVSLPGSDPRQGVAVAVS